MVILVCATARLPFKSTLEPPRKCRMLTPFSKPALLTLMNSGAGPWNHVAVIQPSSCHTVRKRSQSPASRHSAQLWTTSTISCLSINLHPRGFHQLRPLLDVLAQELVELLDRHAHGDGALLGPVLLHLGRVEQLVYFGVQSLEDRPRRSR